MQTIELDRDKPYFRSVSLIAKVFIIQFLTGLFYSDNWAINFSLLKSACCSKLQNHSDILFLAVSQGQNATNRPSAFHFDNVVTHY